MHHLPVRSIALFLAFFLCLSALPLPALAETDAAETTAEPTETTAEVPSEPEISEPDTLPSTEPVNTPTEPVPEIPTETTTPATEETQPDTTVPTTEEAPPETAPPATEETQPETLPPATEETQLETVAAVTMDPIGGQLSPGQSVTLSCATEGATICYALSYDGETYSDYYQYVQPLLPEADFSCFCIKAYAVKMGLPDGPVTEAIFTGTPQSRQSSEGWFYRFGSLHGHSTVPGLRDDLPTPEECYAQARETMDFFAITNHSHTFAVTDSQNDWAAGRAAAADAAVGDFLPLWGYELSFYDDLYLGHLSVFATEDFLSRNQPEFTNVSTALENGYAALAATKNAIGQFNHPSLEFSFRSFTSHTSQADDVMNLLELPEDLDQSFYQMALKNGWHVAPTFGGSSSNGRTAVLASALTEAAFYDALRSRRVYATTDSDLAVDFRLNDAPMGSILSRADEACITVSLSDPTDTGSTQVTVITEARQETQTYDPAGEIPLTFRLPAGENYYYLQIVQADGDIAVTAPIWIRPPEDLGISALSCDTPLPVQGKPVEITLELYNNETWDFLAESIAFYIGDTRIHTMPAMTVAPGRAESCRFSYTHPGMGLTTLRAEVTATVNGEKRTFSQEIPIRFHIPEQVSSILVDSHFSGLSEADLQNLTALAAKSDITLSFLRDTPSAEALQNTGLLILPAPGMPYSDSFLQQLREFLQNGGNLILWGQSAAPEGEFDSAGEVNRLLSQLDISLRLLPGTVTDGTSNSGSPELLSTSVFNEAASWCQRLQPDQIYCQRFGCAVDPGQGEWLVKGYPTTYWQETSEPVLLARETTAAGGNVLLAGSPFLTDSHMPLPKNPWDPARINQSIFMALLDLEEVRTELPLSTIRAAREGAVGSVFRIRGSVTAGTAKAHNAFPGTLYLQDDTGGIAVIPVSGKDIPQNAYMEIIGYREEIQGNIVLYLIDDALISKTGPAADPKTIPNKQAMDYASHGGELLQIEGTVLSITYTADKEGVARFTVKDKNGDLATVLIESYIGAGSSGENTLAEKVLKGKNVRVRGILHMDAGGTPVLRVRNCEEVVYVPPIVTPNTGDQIRGNLCILTLSALGLVLLLRKRKP